MRLDKVPGIEKLRRLVATQSDDCIEWRGNCNRGGYGVVCFNGSSTLAHRAAFEISHGTIPDGLLVRHSCDNPPCVNPRHLLLGTSLDNAHDCNSRGRRPRGQSHYKAKLTDFDVRAIQSSLVPLSVLSKQYGVDVMSIWKIKQGKSWSHISPSIQSQEQPSL